MGTRGAFGYRIGRKLRLMYVQYDGDMLWMILIREIYVLMKHYGSVESLRQAFAALVDAKNQPTAEAIEKCKMFTNLQVSDRSTSDWYCLTNGCQSSFINMLQSGYVYNSGNENCGFTFLLDFNINTARFYMTDRANTVIEHEKATIDEIMVLKERVPLKTLPEIVAQMHQSYAEHVINVTRRSEQIAALKEALKHTTDEYVKRHLEMLCVEERVYHFDVKYFNDRIVALNLLVEAVDVP